MGTHSYCIGRCKDFKSNLRHSQGENIYDENAYCRHCRKYFLKSLLPLCGRAKCPCCGGQVRLGASTSAKNRTKKRRESKINA